MFLSQNRPVHETKWKNMVERGRAQMAIRGMRFACWISKTTETHSEYLIIIAFPQQQCLHERASMLRLLVYCHTCFLRKTVLTFRCLTSTIVDVPHR